MTVSDFLNPDDWPWKMEKFLRGSKKWGCKAKKLGVVTPKEPPVSAQLGIGLGFWVQAYFLEPSHSSPESISNNCDHNLVKYLVIRHLTDPRYLIE